MCKEKNDKVFPAKMLLVNRPCQTHQRSLNNGPEWQQISVGKLSRLVGAYLDTLPHKIMKPTGFKYGLSSS